MATGQTSRTFYPQGPYEAQLKQFGQAWVTFTDTINLAARHILLHSAEKRRKCRPKHKAMGLVVARIPMCGCTVSDVLEKIRAVCRMTGSVRSTAGAKTDPTLWSTQLIS